MHLYPHPQKHDEQCCFHIRGKETPRQSSATSHDTATATATHDGSVFSKFDARPTPTIHVATAAARSATATATATTARSATAAATTSTTTSTTTVARKKIRFDMACAPHLPYEANGHHAVST